MGKGYYGTLKPNVKNMFELFIAKRIYKNSGKEGRVSKPAVRIAMIGIAIGLAIMIIAVAVVIGFKREVREKVIGFGSHIQIGNFDTTTSYETKPIAVDDSLLNLLGHMEGVKHMQRYSTKPGMIKTEDDFLGMVLKGVGQEYELSFYKDHLVEGEVPVFTDTVSSGEVMISRALANKLKLHLGDKIYTYYIQDGVRARRLAIKGIYETNFSEYDNLFLITDIYTVNRLNNWNPDQISGVEIQVENYEKVNLIADELSSLVSNRNDRYGDTYYVETIQQRNPQIFAWLGLLDLNVWVILILMTGVAGFTMISGLLIIILERTNMIGLLKALGADNYTIRKIFLWFSVFLIGKGMLWGNIIGVAFCFLQSKFKVFKLDPQSYYVDTVPIDFHWGVFVLLNICTLFLSILMLVGPSYLISKISPTRAIRYE